MNVGLVIASVTVAVILLASTHVYLWRRLVRDTTTSSRTRRIGTITLTTLGLLLPATLVGVQSAAAEWLAWPGYLWLAVWFYLVLSLLALEIPRLVTSRWLRRAPSTGPTLEAEHAAALSAGQQPNHAKADVAHTDEAGTTGVSRRLLLARGVAITAGLAASGTVGYGVRTALGPPVIDRQQIALARLPRSMDGTRLAVVSDIHLGPLAGKSHVSRIVDKINGLDADIVAIVGDLVDGSVDERGADAEPLARIQSKHGAFFVTGNHEYFSGHQGWLERLEELGIATLRNERRELRLRGGTLDLAGVNDVAGEGYDDGPDYAKTFADRDPDRPVVLMAHQPVQARKAAKYGVDLQVSGHTHGGQMAPFGLLARLQQPVISGLGEVDGVPVYVTNGAGFWGPPVRVGAPPQVTLLELRSS